MNKKIRDIQRTKLRGDSNMSLLHLEAPKYILRHLFAGTFVYKTVSSTRKQKVKQNRIKTNKNYKNFNYKFMRWHTGPW